MADEINVGRLVAEIILASKTDGADEAIEALNGVAEAAKNKPTITVDSNTSEVDKAINSINNLQNTAQNSNVNVDINIQNDDDLNYIRIILEELGVKSDEVDKVLSSAFSDVTGLQEYKKQLEELISKIEQQKEAVAEAQITAQNNPENAISQGFYKDEIELLQKLEAEFDSVSKARDEWVVKQVETLQEQEAATDAAAAKQEELNQKMSDKKSKSDFTLATKSVLTSLKTTNTVLPGVIDNLGTLRANINLFKTAVNSGGGMSGFTAWGTAIAATVGTVATIVVSCIQKIEEEQEKARKAASEAADEFRKNGETIEDITTQYIEAKTKLETLNLTRSEEIELNKTLISLQDELEEAYGSEIEKIDLKNDSLQETINKMREINMLNAEEFLKENEFKAEQAKNTLAQNQTVEIRKEIMGFSDDNSAASLVKDALKELGFKEESGQSPYGLFGTYEVKYKLDVSLEEEKGELTNARNILDSIRNGYKDGTEEYEYISYWMEQLQASIDKIDTEKIEECQNTILGVTEAQKTLENNGMKVDEEAERYNAFFDTVNENISAIGSLNEAYTQLSSGQALSLDSLIELSDKYPELQKYIAETGDLSLRNGEYLKKVAQDTIKSNIDMINSEKAKLEEKGVLTSEESECYEKLKVSAAAYEAQLKTLNSTDLSSLTSSLSSLGSAWAQLNQGKSLDFDTTLSLIDQYPEFAQAMADGSLSIENQAEVIKKLWEVKKQEAISSLELEKQKQLESAKTTQQIVGDIQKQIDAYETEIQLRITMGAAESDYAATLQLVNNLKKQQGDLVQADKDKVAAIDAQIAAIQNLTIETYNSASATSDKNEALAEELKYLEHLKAIGQLTAEEELAWLQRINATYTQNLDERYDMEKRLYNAEKAWREEQEKAIEDALQNEYKWIGYNKNLDSLSKQQELDWLLRIRDQYALNAEQAIELQIKIYEAEKALRDEKLQAEYTAMNNQKSLDRLTSEQELEWLERIRATFALNAEQRMDLEIKIHNLKKQLVDEEQSALEKAYNEALDGIERRKKLSALSYDLEIAYLDEIRRKYKLTAEDAADLEQRIRDLLKDKKDADISALDKLGDAVTEALKNKYEQQRELEEDLINQSIENWKKWEDETTAAIQGQIDALDKLDEAQESEDKRREYELKRQQVELKLAYEKDDYNRKQLQKELNRLDKEEAERLLKEERKAQKEALQQQLDEVKKQSQEQQDALQKELDAIGENYDKLTSSFNLRAETERTMLQSSQKQMIELIKSYAPEYDLAGQSIGESLYNGFYGKYKSIETMVTQIGNFVDSYQRDLARTANAAADNFWTNRSEYEAELTAKASQSAQPANQTISLVVNFNVPVESPIQVRRQLETVVDNLAAEIRK